MKEILYKLFGWRRFAPPCPPHEEAWSWFMGAPYPYCKKCDKLIK